MVYKIFASGTCRILSTLYRGKDQVINTHSFCGSEFHGENFLGKQKNSRNHIQFIKVIKNDISLPSDIMNDFFSAFHNEYDVHKRPSNPLQNIVNIRNTFDLCDFYIFEIASLKINTRNNFYVSDENTDNYLKFRLSEDELITDLEEIINLIGIDKNIIFINHLRLHKFNGGPIINNREIIYKVISNITQKYKNVYQYDPTLMIKDNSEYNKYMDDPWHYNSKGYSLQFISLLHLMNNIKNNTHIKINNLENIKGILEDSEDEDREVHILNKLRSS
jgi:hypothetical protein